MERRKRARKEVPPRNGVAAPAVSPAVSSAVSSAASPGSVPQKVSAVLAEAASRIRPERPRCRGAEAFIKELNRLLKGASLSATAVLGGSTAKGTFLRGDHDIDVFVRFDLRYASASLSDLLAPLLPSAERIHGSRDYFQLRRHGYLFEVVPVLLVRRPEEARNVTDMSPLHVAYVVDAIRRDPALADEIRLAKQFCKSIKVYGAESYINGFSGHVLDLLIIRYGSFLKLLKRAARWGDLVVLDPAGHHVDPRFSLNVSKRLGPMILVDPIQPQRNAAAALSRPSFERFKEAAQAFLEQPALKYFTIEPLTPSRIKAEYARRKHGFGMRTKLIIFATEAHPGKDDVVATKLLKLHEHIVRLAGVHGFTVLDEGFEYDRGKRNALHYLVFKSERLSATQEQTGPPLSSKADARKFRAKHADATERGGRLYAKVRRSYRTPAELVTGIIATPYVRERCVACRILLGRR